ncbi:hypothetical protein GCM10010193_23960 [Kitasatospora atroaurantiaca]|uniref:Amino acid adenylation domain-containing protein n=1 Tax=Kitasatospora atroaurantiaca TaxID=285545 RepID=A0A561F0Z2_9ACTN|nr:amino acid adenylation domain-containing protein [Kitasatospora atroaurantiaca]TWE21530.1 amino acid adenylation domain-containing protein [Kitasatospora atroaurantiaca]
MSSEIESIAEAKAIHQLFGEQAHRAPEAPAVVCGEARLTYGELDAGASRLARHLAELGLGRGGLAAVALGRGPELLTAVLAVLKTGAAYVPLEPSGPDMTIRHILSEADPLVVITQEVHRVRLADATGRAVLCLDTAAEAIAAQPSGPGPLGVEVQPTDLACVFYTSGSTGKPKGALIEHRNLLHAYRGWQSVYQLSPADRFLQTATLEFDVFSADWIRALCTGGTLVMAERNFTLDHTAEVSELHDLVLREGITVMETNVHTLRRLFAHIQPRGLELGTVRLLSVGAEKWYLDEQLRLQRYLGPGVRHINVYGVAEATVDSTYFDTTTLADAPEHAERISLIGQPFPGTRVHLLDQAGRPVPTGEPGEICLAGPGLGRGYLHRPELTAERFRPTEVDEDGRIYRTGDIGRLRPDGLLEYIGRSSPAGPPDAKEVAAMAEVEAVLRGHPSVQESAVAKVETAPGRTRLVAYAVAAEGGTADPWTLRSYLSEQLPESLVPEAVVPLQALPRTRAGKLDRPGLPLPAPRGHGESFSGKAARPGGAEAGGYRAGSGGSEVPRGTLWAVLTITFGVLASALTEVFWRGSTEVSAVPSPWAGLLRLLYICEWLSFGAGMAFLFLGRRILDRHARPTGLTSRTLLAVAWLLGAWWPQDNWYRVSRHADWPRQVALVYGFNVTLIIAAVVVVRFLAWQPPRSAVTEG